MAVEQGMYCPCHTHYPSKCQGYGLGGALRLNVLRLETEYQNTRLLQITIGGGSARVSELVTDGDLSMFCQRIPPLGQQYELQASVNGSGMEVRVSVPCLLSPPTSRNMSGPTLTHYSLLVHPSQQNRRALDWGLGAFPCRRWISRNPHVFCLNVACHPTEHLMSNLRN